MVRLQLGDTAVARLQFGDPVAARSLCAAGATPTAVTESVPQRSVPQRRGPTTAAAAAATTPTATGFALRAGATVAAGRLGHRPENGQDCRANLAGNHSSPR